jgi:hypothetical protein
MVQQNLKKEILDLLQDECYINSLAATVESPAARYCHSAILLLSQENPHFFKKFLSEYVCLIKGKSIPIFKVPTMVEIYKKWLRYPRIIKEIKSISLKVKSRSNDVDFWSQFIASTALDKAKPELQAARIDLIIILLNCNILKIEDWAKHGIVIDTILKLNIHQDDFQVLKNKLNEKDHPYYRMFFLIKRYIDLKIPGLEIAEMIKMQFSTPDRSFKYSEKIEEFYLLLEHKLPADYSLLLRKMDIGKLFHIYQICPSLFESLEIELEKSLNLDSLLQYLFNNYMISGVFLRAYSYDQISSIEMNWFKDELIGNNIIYSETLPFKLTRKAAHHFRCLPFTMELSVTRALIYSTICTAVNDEHFAMIVARSIRSLDRAEYWIQTMILLHKNGLRFLEVREVIDYLNEKVIVEREQICLKNKSIRNLMLEIDTWHEQLREKRILKSVGYKKLAESNIGPYYIDYEGISYLIKQIKRTKELFEEGRLLHHCVYTYRKECLDGETFIFSLRTIDEKADEFPLITIEVVSNKILQAKGKFNRSTTEIEKEIIRLWAKENQLQFLK